MISHIVRATKLADVKRSRVSSRGRALVAGAILAFSATAVGCGGSSASTPPQPTTSKPTSTPTPKQTPTATPTPKPTATPTPGETVLYSFLGGNDGAGPNGDLIADATGALYGTTSFRLDERVWLGFQADALGIRLRRERPLSVPRRERRLKSFVRRHR